MVAPAGSLPTCQGHVEPPGPTELLRQRTVPGHVEGLGGRIGLDLGVAHRLGAEGLELERVVALGGVPPIGGGAARHGHALARVGRGPPRPGRLPLQLRTLAKSLQGGLDEELIGLDLGREEPVHELAQRRGRHVFVGQGRVLQQGVVELLGTRRALVGVALQGRQHDPLEPPREARHERARRRDGLLGDGPQHLDLILAPEQPLVGGQLVEQDAEAEHVAALVERPALALLRAHVGVLAGQHPGQALGLPVAARRLGDPEVEHLHLAAEAHQDVLRADVAVDDLERHAVQVAHAVGVMQAQAGVHDHAQRRCPAQLAARLVDALDQLRDGRPGDILHDHGQRLVDQPDVEHVDEVGMVEARPEPRLVVEHLHEGLVVGPVRQDGLEGHQPVEDSRASLDGEVDLGHSPGGDLPHQDVIAEPFAEQHRVLRGSANPSVPARGY
jgi:hypothetical protein